MNRRKRKKVLKREAARLWLRIRSRSDPESGWTDYARLMGIGTTLAAIGCPRPRFRNRDLRAR